MCLRSSLVFLTAFTMLTPFLRFVIIFWEHPYPRQGGKIQRLFCTGSARCYCWILSYSMEIVSHIIAIIKHFSRVESLFCLIDVEELAPVRLFCGEVLEVCIYFPRGEKLGRMMLHPQAQHLTGRVSSVSSSLENPSWPPRNLPPIRSTLGSAFPALGPDGGVLKARGWYENVGYHLKTTNRMSSLEMRGETLLAAISVVGQPEPSSYYLN